MYQVAAPKPTGFGTQVYDSLNKSASRSVLANGVAVGAWCGAPGAGLRRPGGQKRAGRRPRVASGSTPGGKGAGISGSGEWMTPVNQPGSWVGRRGRGRTGQRVGVWSFGAVRRTDFYALRGEKRAVGGLGVVVADGQGPKNPAAWLR